MIKKSQAIFIIIVVFTLMGITMYLNQEEKTEDTPIQEWCEVGQVMSDGSIVYNGSAGTTELVAFATSDGPKLMAKCNEHE